MKSTKKFCSVKIRGWCILGVRMNCTAPMFPTLQAASYSYRSSCSSKCFSRHQPTVANAFERMIITGDASKTRDKPSDASFGPCSHQLR